MTMIRALRYRPRCKLCGVSSFETIASTRHHSERKVGVRKISFTATNNGLHRQRAFRWSFLEIHQEFSLKEPLLGVHSFPKNSSTNRIKSLNTVSRLFSSSEKCSHDEQIIGFLRQKQFGPIEELLHRILHQEKEEILPLRIFHCILSEITKRNHKEAGLQAEAMLNIMMEFHLADRLDEEPDMTIFGLAISAWTNSSHKEKSHRAKMILDEIERLSEEKILSVKPNTSHFNSLMQSYSKSGNVKAAQALLNRMWKACKSGNNPNAAPDLATMSFLLEAHARSGHPKAGKKAEQCLDMVVEYYDSGLLDSMPDKACYNSVIKAYSLCGDVKGAEAILERMYKDYDENGNVEAAPDLNSFNAVLDANTRSSSSSSLAAQSDGATSAERILDLIIELNDWGGLQAKPNVISYSSVIKAYAKAGDGPNATRVWNRMYKDFKDKGNASAEPDFVSCLQVLEGWTKSNDENAGEHAESFLNLIIQLHRSKKLRSKPNTYCYNAVLKTWAKFGNSKRAQALYKQMVQDYNQSRDKSLKPNLSTFRNLLLAWAVSGSPDSGGRADVLLDHMAAFDLNPDKGILFSAKKCWESSPDRHRAKATERIQELQQQIDRLKWPQSR
jgi:pentatricopeptide repeat protein